MNIKPFVYTFLAMTLALAPVPVQAAIFSGGNNVSVSSPSIINTNVYAGGGDVSVSVPINGDVYTWGGNVTISNTVRDDVTLAGGTVTILAPVGGDVRVAGGTVLISKPVGGDLVVLGGTVRVTQEATIGGDVILAGGSINFDGIARQKLNISGGSVVINGQAQEVISKAGEFTMGDTARIYGPVSYESPKEGTISNLAQISGKVTYTKGNIPNESERKNQITAILGIFSFVKTLLFITAGLILIFFFKRGTKEILLRSVDNFGNELVRGLVAFFAIPFVIILLCFTLIGLLPAVFLGALYTAAIVISLPIAGIIVGGLIERYALKKEVSLSWQWSILGILLLVIAGTIPFIGFAIRIVFYATAFGTLIHGTQEFLAQKR